MSEVPNHESDAQRSGPEWAAPVNLEALEPDAGWDHRVDVLIAGSGASGQAAALRACDLGLDVLIVEKLPRWGGNAAMSAGAIWVPANRWMRDLGIEDCEEDGVRYLRAVTEGAFEEPRIQAFIRQANRMLEYLTTHTRLTLTSMVEYPDYHDALDGGRVGGRGLEADPVDGGTLGPDLHTLERPYPGELMLGKFMMSCAEARSLLNPGISPYLTIFRSYLKYARRAGRRRRLGGRDPHLTMGQAMMARLRLSLNDRAVPLWLDAPLVELVTRGGRVAGAIVRRDGREIRVGARCGVMLGAGGFEHNDEMRRRFLRRPINATWSAASLGNTGDGIRLGEELGAKLDTRFMSDAWWAPAIRPPGDGYSSVMVIEKSLPHSIFVNRRGHRFTNEAASYTAVVQAMFADDEATGANVPCWWVFDGRYRRRFPIGTIWPGRFMSDAALAKKHPLWAPGAGWLFKASTVRELAQGIEIDPDALEATIARFNLTARSGNDLDFGRGETAFDRYYSDSSVKPNPSLGALETPPFYAIAVYPSDLGTRGGLATDDFGRVLDESSNPIQGLYAGGNVTTNVMGKAYPGPGVTLSSALTSGFVAAEAIHADIQQATADEREAVTA